MSATNFVAGVLLALSVSLAGPASAQEASVVQGLTRDGRMDRRDARELARRVHDRLVENARRGGGDYDPLRQALGLALFGGPGRSRAEYNERLLQVIEHLGEGLTQANLRALFAPSREAPLRCAELFQVAMTQCDALIAAAAGERRDLPYMAPDPGAELQGDLTSAGLSAAQANEIVRSLSSGLLSVPASLDRSPRGRGLERLMRACPGGLPDRDSQVRAWHVGATSGLARCLGRAAGREGRRATSLLQTALGMSADAAVPFLRWAHGQSVEQAPPRAPARPPAPVGPSEDQLRAQARAHFRARRFAEAERTYRQLAQLAPNDAGAHAGLGASLLRMGRAADATAAYRRATELDGRNAGYVAALGGAFEAAGNVASARAAYQHALSLDPNQRGARQRLAQLSPPAPARAPTPAGPAIAAQTQPAPPPAGPPAPALPPNPSREEIVRALAPLESRLEACAPTIDAVVVFRVRIHGPTGVISEVEMIGQDATEEQGNCMEAHIRHARFPPFGQPQFEIRYPYALRGPNAPDEAPPSVDAD